MESSPLKIHVLRGSRVESEHLVDAVVLGKQSHMMASFGKGQEIVTYPRSAIKMLQAVALVESGAFHHFGLSTAHLALACSSHQGEPIHVDMVKNWLLQLQMSEKNLVCGAHYPADEKSKFDLIAQGIAPGKCHNNCSGKHSGFLSVMKFLGMPFENYQEHSHPFQVYLRNILSELCEEDLNLSEWGVDGCGIPTYAMKLISIAKGMNKFLGLSTPSSQREKALKAILTAVQTEPAYFSGSKGFSHDVISETDGDIIIKSGAEGTYSGLSLSKGFSFAVKVHDGNPRAAMVASLWILQNQEALSDKEKVRLSEHREPVIKNWAGQVVGKIIVADDSIR